MDAEVYHDTYQGVAKEAVAKKSVRDRVLETAAVLVGVIPGLLLLLDMIQQHYNGRRCLRVFEVLMVLACLAYVADPVDAVPDVIPVAGIADDAAVVAMTMTMLTATVAQFRRWREMNPPVPGDIAFGLKFEDVLTE